MPTAYWIETTEQATKLVEDNDFDGIKIYINDDKHGNKVFQIAGSAIDKNNYDVLKLIKNKINFNQYKDGNAYGLIHLAMENITEYDHKKNMFYYLIDLAKETDQDIKSELAFASRLLICNDPDFEFIDFIIAQDINLWNLFHYSIVWNYPKITEHLLKNYSHKIDVEKILPNSLKLSDRFIFPDSIKFLNNYYSNHKSKKIKRILSYHKLIQIKK
jgi:hypothetical protein